MKTTKKDGVARSFVAWNMALLCAGLSGSVVAADKPEQSGKQVVDKVCSACHLSGKDGAPRIGNTEEWSKHAAQGLSAMTKNAITGVRKMPAHGGQNALSDLEISRAVSYMVSGGKAADPSKPYSSPQQKSGEQVVKDRCQDCHATGKNGAPRIGDAAAWQPRLQGGVDALTKSAIHGHNAMPARAGIGNLSDADIAAAVVFMVNQSTAAHSTGK